MREPNFFIIGAPKCGTTSLATWLDDNPNIFMSTPKEPGYYCFDLGLARLVRSEQTYNRLFERATRTHLAVGEATAGYLRSSTAVPSILKRYPQARFVIGIRNPVDMAHSWHGECVFQGVETERDFARAWELQSKRRLGKSLPMGCSDPSRLMYSDVCQLGSQLERLFSWVDREQVFVYVLDDLSERPRDIYRSVLAFLSVPDDGQQDFKALNLARRVPIWLSATSGVVYEAKFRLGIYGGLGLITKIRRLLSTPGNPPLSDKIKQQLSEHFEPEVYKLEKLLGLDLNRWRCNSKLPLEDGVST